MIIDVGKQCSIPTPPRMIDPSPVRITVTGAAGRVAYALLFRIASGSLLGASQPIELVLFDLPRAKKAVQGVAMELEDCSFPLLQRVVVTDDPAVAFADARIVFLIGARSRTAAMERREVLADNAKIFAMHGATMGRVAHPDCRALVVGNPCNTNAYVAIHAARKAGRLTERAIIAMLRLDHNRALAQLALKTGRAVANLERVTVWGNHSPAIYVDDRFAIVDGQGVNALIAEADWSRCAFVAAVEGRGAAVLATHGLYAAASAATAALDQMRDWLFGTGGRWTTMGVASDGSYGVPEGLVFGFPVTAEAGDYRIVTGLEIDAIARKMIDANVRELSDERDAVHALLPALFA